MCAPLVIKDVHEELSRRGFLGIVTAGVVAASRPAAAQARVRFPKGFREIVDLTHAFSPSLPVYPGYKPVQIRPRFSIEHDGFAANEVTFDEHTGTHVDAPSHFVTDARVADVDRFLNRDPKGTLHAPGFSEQAARFLVTERDISGVAVDTLSLDAGAAPRVRRTPRGARCRQIRHRDAREPRPRSAIRSNRHRRRVEA
jgi:kynurenine formamidase